MEWNQVIAAFFVLAKALLIFVACAFFVSGLDDLFVDIAHSIRLLYRRFWVMRRHRALTLEQLVSRDEQWLAVMIPAWDESAVIGQMLRHLLTTVNYTHFYVFVGAYQNDSGTQRSVLQVRETFENVELVVCPKDGPTNKADCLNWLYQAILNFEQEKQLRFEVFVMHDAEDIAHPISFKLFNYLIPSKKDMVQLPVVPLESGWKDFVGGHYLDEFAENHFKDLPVRETLSGILPSAGVGCALARKGIEDICTANRNQLFAVDTLTEDYELGFRLGSVGANRQAFVRKAFNRVVVKEGFFTGQPRQRQVREYIATREYFPREFSAAIRQKSRWIYGITIQGWKHLKWGRGFWTSYMLHRDRKSLLTNQVNLLGYLVLLFGVGYWLIQALVPESYRYPPLVEKGTWLWYLVLADTGFMAVRLFQRAFAVKLIYGWDQALLSAPRQVFMNVINFMATARALGLLARRLLNGKDVVWEKTAHVFPSREELRQFHRRLGELLLERRQIKVEDLDRSLEIQRQVQRPLGTLLLEQRLITEEDLLAALGSQLEMETSEVDPYEIPREIIQRVPRSLAIQHSVFPIGIDEAGRLVLATDRKLEPDETEDLRNRLQGAIEIVLAPRSDLAFAIRRGWNGHVGPDQPRLGPALRKRGVLSSETAEQMAKAQRRTYQRIGDVLCELRAIKEEQLHHALRDFCREKEGKLGDFLVRSGLITELQLQLALETQRHRFCLFGKLVTDHGYADTCLVERISAERRAWAGFIESVRHLPSGQIWMFDPSCQFPDIEGKLDQDDLLELADANCGRQGFVCFGLDVLGGGGVSLENQDTLRRALQRGLTTNVIVERPHQADRIFGIGLLPILRQNGNAEAGVRRTPGGREVRDCPRLLREETCCGECALCARGDRKFVLRFREEGRPRDLPLLGPRLEGIVGSVRTRAILH